MHSVWLATTAFQLHLNSYAQLATTVLQAPQAKFLVHLASTLQEGLQFAQVAHRPQLRMVELPTTPLVSALLAPWEMSLLPLLLHAFLVLQAHSALAQPANVEFMACIYIYKYILIGVSKLNAA